MCMRFMADLLMVVLIIDHFGIALHEFECQPPIAIDPDGPMSGQITGQAMQAPTWQAHIFRRGSDIQPAELQTQPCGMFRAYSGLASGFEERRQAFVREAFDHFSVSRGATPRNAQDHETAKDKDITRQDRAMFSSAARTASHSARACCLLSLACIKPWHSPYSRSGHSTANWIAGFAGTRHIARNPG